MSEVDYGTDLSCTSDLTPEGHTVTGRRLLAEALVRRYITPRGRLIGSPNYGYDITDRLNDDVSERDLASMRAGMRNEALKDERVLSAKVTTLLDVSGDCTITLELRDRAGPFRLVLAASAVTVKILELVE